MNKLSSLLPILALCAACSSTPQPIALPCKPPPLPAEFGPPKSPQTLAKLKALLQSTSQPVPTMLPKSLP